MSATENVDFLKITVTDDVIRYWQLLSPQPGDNTDDKAKNSMLIDKSA